MKLVTKRLLLRELAPNDAAAIVEQINNLNVVKHLMVVPYPYSIKDARLFITMQRKNARKKPRPEYCFGIVLRQEKKLIGIIGITTIDRFTKTASLGYWLGEQYWGQGIMTEAVTKVLDFCFAKLKLQRINAHVFVENIGSQKILEKMGFIQEGLLRNYQRSKATGKIHNVYHYGLLEKEHGKR